MLDNNIKAMVRQYSAPLASFAVLLALLLLTAQGTGAAPRGDEELLDRFNKYIRDKSDDARVTVVQSIEKVDSAAAVEALEKSMSDKSWRVRGAVLAVLSGYRSADAVAAIEDLAKSGRPEPRSLAVQALGDIGSPTSLDILVTAAGDSAWQVRRAAAEALGAYSKKNKALDDAGRARVIELLGALIGDSEFVVRTNAADALGRVNHADCVPLLVGALDDSAWQVQAASIQGLSKIRDKQAIEPLIALLKIEGRLQDDSSRALKAITTMDFGMNADSWEKWWVRTKDRFELPEVKKNDRRRPLAGNSSNKAAGGAQRDNPAAKYATRARYYGIPTPSQRILFLLDVSYSMREEVDILKPERFGDNGFESTVKIEIAKEELVRAIEGFSPRTKINIITYHTDVDRWKKSLQELSDSTRKEAIKFVKKQKSRGERRQTKSRPGRRAARPNTEDGRTNTWDALQAAFKASGIGTYDKAYDTAVDTIFLLSDGEPTAGKLVKTTDIVEEIARLNKLRRVVIHTINFGKDPNGARFLRQLAEGNGGTFVDLVGVHE